MKRIVLLAAFSMALTGCATAEDDLKKAAGICEAGGTKPGTPVHQACVSDELAKMEEDRRYAAAAVGNAFKTYGQSMQQQSAYYQSRRPINCTSNAVGTYTYTNCY